MTTHPGFADDQPTRPAEWCPDCYRVIVRSPHRCEPAADPGELEWRDGDDQYLSDWQLGHDDPRNPNP